MNAAKALPMIGLCCVAAACSDNNSYNNDGDNPAPVPENVSFANELVDIVTNDAGNAKPRSVEDKTFDFGDETAFSGLFPGN